MIENLAPGVNYFAAMSNTLGAGFRVLFISTVFFSFLDSQMLKCPAKRVPGDQGSRTWITPGTEPAGSIANATLALSCADRNRAPAGNAPC